MRKLGGKPGLAMLAIALWTPFAAQAQVSLDSAVGTTETPVTTVYNYGNIPAGNTADVRFRAHDTGSSAIVLTSLIVSNSSFSIVGAPSLPYTIAPGNFLEFTVRLSAAEPGSFSANLQVVTPVNHVNIQLLAMAVAAPVLGGLPPCSPDIAVANQVDFPSVPFGALALCNFSIENPYSQPLLITSLAVSGNGFQLTNAPGIPATIPPGGATSFTIEITPVCGTNTYSGSLTIGTQALAQTFPLAASAAAPALAKPSFTFDPPVFASGEQVALTLSLASPYPCPALFAGYLNLSFMPATTLVTDDPAIVFLPGSTRSLPLSMNASGTRISIGGQSTGAQSSAIFQTGTTAGSLTFSVTTTGLSLSSASTTTAAIPAAPIAIQTAAASNQQFGSLNLEVIAVDNTYTAGAMSFTFFDTSGKPIGGGPIAADFTSSFKTFFSSQQSGGAFLMNVSFPVTGNELDIGSVEVTLTNSAGKTQTGSLAFQ